MDERVTGCGLGSPNIDQSQHGCIALLHGLRHQSSAPSDVAFGSPRVKHFDQSSVDLAREIEINCTKERRLTSCPRTTKYLEAIRRYHNRNVKDRSFVVGDLVLKWKTSQEGMHKLSTPQEGPFVVAEVTRPTSYRLAYPDGTSLPNSWHIDKLRCFYP